MKNAIILHGRPKRADYYAASGVAQSNAHWLPWLQQQLIVRDIFAVTPDIPHAYEPVWERWVQEVERFEIAPDTMLIGHSCGAGFWVRYLSEHPELQVGKVVLVAPWIDVERDDPNRFFDFVIDPGVVARTKNLAIFHSTNDAPEIQSSVKKLRQELTGITYKEFKDFGHFDSDKLRDNGFPGLLDELLR